MEFINSLDNSTIKKIKKLKQRKYRKKKKKFLAEGRKFLDFTYTPDLIILKENFEDFENITTKLERFDCRKIVVMIKYLKI